MQVGRTALAIAAFLWGAGAAAQYAVPSKANGVHDPMLDASTCISLYKVRGSYSGFLNLCDGDVHVFYCAIEWECTVDKWYETTLKPRNHREIGRGTIRWAACRGSASGGFVEGSKGESYYCAAAEPSEFDRTREMLRLQELQKACGANESSGACAPTRPRR